MTNDHIIKTFGNQLRVRVSGILIKEDKILLIKHTSLGKKGIFWSPPGGGLNFGESVNDCLKREFYEETGLTIEVKKFLFVHEFLHPPLHAIELFFLVTSISPDFQIGKDPELSHKDQIILDVKFFSGEEIRKEDPEIMHSILQKEDLLSSPEKLKGFYSSNYL